ncbi:NAD+ synthase [Epilithonimonas bovis DSM 19482]|uniref:NH(3)-dependent NAD(+) synthetase n=1 Tax=Epilithonimonas bovis DSM 19482 TaxID=1121284 RepID=A0A1U7PWV7_9FLAO|nr:NAD(+) synthase [Epilithonimonas bovis]SIT96463.1 NAD+ synthase [Epilithonimonas bovis DSM 19482]
MQTQKVIDHIVNWLRDYATNAKVNGFIIGVSGGIDSAVVSTLAAKTGLKTLVLEMPIRQKADQVDRAQDHIEFLKANFSNVEGFTVNLTDVFESFETTVNDYKEGAWSKNLALANTRSRFRMVTLYYYGQLNGLLVTGTGNKVEDFGVGFYTKYGDGGVDISPIADLYKTQVYEIAKELNILESIQKAAPTDGLWDADKTDEDQMGATYPELEWAMEQQADGKTATDFEGRQKEAMEIYLKLNKATQHKMNPIPVCEIPKELK